MKETEDINSNFVLKHFVELDRVDEDGNYLTSVMRNSIIERILTTFLLKSKSKDYNLYGILSEAVHKTSFLPIKSALELFRVKFEPPEPLSFFNELLSELWPLINRILRDPKEISGLTQDDETKKIEYLLASHFENNFFLHQAERRLEDQYFNDSLVSTWTNFNYSVACLGTIFKFLKVFEKQSLSCKFPESALTHEDGYISEKKYYFYLDTINKDKMTPGNLVDYIIRNIEKKCQDLCHDKLNNYQMENYITINIFLIQKILKFYSFYFEKQPELENIFISLKKFRNWPLPVGNIAVELNEMLINEMMLQGVSILNHLRETFFLDLLDDRVKSIQTKYFTSATLIFSNEWEKRKYTEELSNLVTNKFDLAKFLKYICTRSKNKKGDILKLRDLIIKIFITVLFNSKEKFTEKNIENIISNFSLETGKGANDSEKIFPKISLEMLFKILDVGFDKNYDDFLQDISIIAQQLIQLPDTNTSIKANINLTPITEYRYYLKPQYTQIKKLYSNPYESSGVDLYDIYKSQFQFVVTNYFPKFIGGSDDDFLSDPMEESFMEERRNKFYHNFRVNLVLIEEKNVINHFIENMNQTYSKMHLKMTDEDFFTLWKYFIKSKEDLEIKFLLYVVPHYEKPIENPFRVLTQGDTLENDSNYLSEFIANNDQIYKNIVFIPWSSKCDPGLAYYTKEKDFDSNMGDVLNAPQMSIFYSFLKEPLDSYLMDAHGLFNLHLYNCIFDNDDSLFRMNKIFWKSVEFTMAKPTQVKKDPKGKKDEVVSTSSSCTVTLYCVDMLGVEFKEEKKVVLQLQEPFQIKIFNLFYRKNAPFNYNTSSNNGWLEVFVCENFCKKELDKIYNCNSQQSNIKFAYYEEFVTPQIELETVYKNFKVKSMIIEANDRFTLRIDENEVIESKHPKLIFSRLDQNGRPVSVPVATFTSI